MLRHASTCRRLRELESLIASHCRGTRRESVHAAGTQIRKKPRRLMREARNWPIGARLGKPLAGDLQWADPYIAPFLLPRSYPSSARMPDLKLYLREETTSSLAHSLHPGIHCVLLALPYHCARRIGPLFRDRLFVASRKPRCHTRPRASDPRDRQRAASARDGHCLRIMRLPPQPPELRATQSGTSLHTLIQMVDNNLA